MPESSARILHIRLRCGMIAREEQEIVRSLIRSPLASRGGAQAAPRPAASAPG